ncbi:AAA family ATPase [uncultured Imperialibacter sp.]|uniref:AAA family ATPase n=1 Tax=uncultured Imperialibacter sp. TaxID=1672639 RepID=UPI0030DD86FD|tara:strand:+ start:60956 stop:62128 length:1173 start_codon:yes stop_codon:yes gene_type:complete
MIETQRKYSLKKIHFQNFKGIKEISLEGLPEGAPWIFLTGENGFGKTSILQAIASSLAGWEEHISSFKINQIEFSIESELFGSSEKWGIANENISGKLFLSKERWSSADFRYLACYGSSRLDTYIESSHVKSSPTISLYSSQSLLENIEYQFTRWYSKQEDSEFKAKYTSVKKLLIDLLGLKDIEVDFKTDKVLYIEQDSEGNPYEKMALQELASGYRSIISMVGDMVLKLFKRQPEIHTPSELKGIVIIDELDLHFHPKWQKKLPGLLTKIFPGIQFISSTHSPIPLLGAPVGSVFLKVNRNTTDGITLERLEEFESQMKDFLPNAILTSPIFGLQDIFPTSHTGKSRIRTEDSFNEIVVNKELQKRLKKFKGSSLEEDLLKSLSEKNK